MKRWGINLADDLTPETFPAALGAQLLSQSHIWLLSTKERPVGLFLGAARGGRVLAMQAVWFPWASSRSVMEGTANFLHRMRGIYILLITASKRDVHFMNLMGVLGLTRTVGIIEGIEETPMTLFQTKDII